jgi:hypothetical protein
MTLTPHLHLKPEDIEFMSALTYLLFNFNSFCIPKKKNFNSFIQYEILTHNWYISTKYYIFRNKRRYMSLVRFTMNGIFVFMIDWAFGIVQSTTIKLVVWPINTLLVYYLVIYSIKNILIVLVCYLLFFFQFEFNKIHR